MNQGKGIETVHRPTAEQLYRDYQSKRKPVLITGLIDEWPAAAWTPQNLSERFFDTKLTYESWAGGEPSDNPIEFFREQQTSMESSFGEFVKRMTDVKEPTRSFYCAGFPLLTAIPELGGELGDLEPYMAMSKMWRPSARRRMMFGPYLWLGPMGSLSPLHFDRTDNFLVQVYGQKRWTLIAPRYNTDVYFPCPQLSSTVMHFSPVDIEKPDLSAYPRFANVTPVEFVMGPGEVLYMPAGWWHHVRSLESSISINYFFIRPVSNIVGLRAYLWARLKRRLGAASKGG